MAHNWNSTQYIAVIPRRISREVNLWVVSVLFYPPTLPYIITDVVNWVFQHKQPSSLKEDGSTSIQLAISTAGVSGLVWQLFSITGSAQSYNLIPSFCVYMCVRDVTTSGSSFICSSIATGSFRSSTWRKFWLPFCISLISWPGIATQLGGLAEDGRLHQSTNSTISALCWPLHCRASSTVPSAGWREPVLGIRTSKFPKSRCQRTGCRAPRNKFPTHSNCGVLRNTKFLGTRRRINPTAQQPRNWSWDASQGRRSRLNRWSFTTGWGQYPHLVRSNPANSGRNFIAPRAARTRQNTDTSVQRWGTAKPVC